MLVQLLVHSINRLEKNSAMFSSNIILKPQQQKQSNKHILEWKCIEFELNWTFVLNHLMIEGRVMVFHARPKGRVRKFRSYCLDFHSSDCTYVKQDSFVIIPPTYSCFILQVKKILLKVYTIHKYINLIASFKSILQHTAWSLHDIFICWEL